MLAGGEDACQHPILLFLNTLSTREALHNGDIYLYYNE